MEFVALPLEFVLQEVSLEIMDKLLVGQQGHGIVMGSMDEVMQVVVFQTVLVVLQVVIQVPMELLEELVTAVAYLVEVFGDHLRIRMIQLSVEQQDMHEYQFLEM